MSRHWNGFIPCHSNGCGSSGMSPCNLAPWCSYRHLCMFSMSMDKSIIISYVGTGECEWVCAVDVIFTVYGHYVGLCMGKYPAYVILLFMSVQSCFTSTETIRTIRDWKPRTPISTFTQFLSWDFAFCVVFSNSNQNKEKHLICFTTKCTGFPDMSRFLRHPGLFDDTDGCVCCQHAHCCHNTGNIKRCCTFLTSTQGVELRNTWVVLTG